jgi:serine/threonine protein phosphatase PrpC
MPPNSPESKSSKGGLWARLFGVTDETKEQAKPDAEADELLPVFDAVPEPPLALPVSEAVTALPEEEKGERAAAAPVAEAIPAELCPSCQTPRKGSQAFCDECGWVFPVGGAPATATSVSAGKTAMSSARLRDRYEVRELLGERGEVCRFHGLDHGDNGRTPSPVVIVRSPLLALVESILSLDDDLPAAQPAVDDELLPTFDAPEAVPVAAPSLSTAGWPSAAWERDLLDKARHPALPAVIEAFTEGDYDYLIEEVPQGRSLWDAWDDPDADAEVRYGWLGHIAEGLHALHQAGAIIEGLRPDIITITAQGQAMIADLADLLPLPVPGAAPIRATLYTAPELIVSPQEADARADLYSFGAMLYALEYLHHDLEEKDFERPYYPKQITDRYPDVHPLFFRLISKTFVRDVNTRFPTDEASKIDPTGFTELVRTLEVCRRSFDHVRLDIAAWTTTGMVRSGNEDALAFLHGVESRQDELHEYALVLLADGMGGYEAGEVAAALAIQKLRENLLGQPMFSALAGKEPPAAASFDVDKCKKVLETALKHANKEVHTAARTPGKGKRGMGCTAEAVYLDAANVVVGHVGDSRTYHLRQGRLIQLTRDQTLVSRLVELGQLTEEEAEHHERKNELQQAIGGQPDVTPGLYSAKLKRGDWVLVCSDGLTNHVPAADLEKMLLRETASSAEEAARRLLNLANLRGATDNASVVVVRAV